MQLRSPPGTRERAEGGRDILKVPRDPPGLLCAQDRSWQAPSQPDENSTLIRRLSTFASTHAASPRVVLSPWGPQPHPPEAMSSTWSMGCKGMRPLSSLSCATVALSRCGPDTCSTQALDQHLSLGHLPTSLPHCPPGTAGGCPAPWPPPRVLPSQGLPEGPTQAVRVQPLLQAGGPLRGTWSPQGSRPPWIPKLRGRAMGGNPVGEAGFSANSSP